MLRSSGVRRARSAPALIKPGDKGVDVGAAALAAHNARAAQVDQGHGGPALLGHGVHHDAQRQVPPRPQAGAVGHCASRQPQEPDIPHSQCLVCVCACLAVPSDARFDRLRHAETWRVQELDCSNLEKQEQQQQLPS